ncbi:MAG TPA: HD domain-containing phosphohydrolase [Candidatus Eisenbacteria bacterium]|nr:HD domain-containing phosphohydrolase [Candidatus Eisenbacteria bacterium]
MTPRGSDKGPSQSEIKLRKDLDVARRELAKLRKAAPGGKDGPGEGDSPEAAELHRQIVELTETRKRLARLYFGQVEDSRRRSERLDRVLDALAEFRAADAGDIAGRLAELVRAHLGFKRAVVRVREGEAFVARGFAGVSDEARARLAAEPVASDAVQDWCLEDCRIGRSWLVRHDHPRRAALPVWRDVSGEPRDGWDWHPGDVLLVALRDQAGGLAGMVRLGEPEDGALPTRETVALIELAAAQAAVALDAAEARQAVEEGRRRMREAAELKSQFLATVSHELRTPLAAIRACVGALRPAGEPVDAARLGKVIAVLDAESTRLASLIESVLDLNRHDTGRAEPARQTVDFAQIASEVLQLLAPVARAGEITLKLQRGDADTRVEGDRDQLRQLALHLGGNAVKFTPAGGTVTMRLEANAREVTLRVEDTGIGIPEQALGRIFERFYQVDATAVRRHSGSGLGLAICKSIVESHGGRIRATSALGRGSCFTVVVPRGPHVRTDVRALPASRPHADDLIRLSVELIAEVMNARVVSVMAPGSNGELYVRAALGLEERVVRSARVRRGEAVAGWVAEQRRPLCVRDAAEPGDAPASGRGHYATATYLSVPLEGAQGLLGVLNVTDPRSGRPFESEDAHLLLHLARTVAEAWDKMWETHKPDDGLVDRAQAMRWLTRHVGRTRRSVRARMRLAREIARELGLDAPSTAAIAFAAVVHDVGMEEAAGELPDAARGLNSAERRAMQRHIELGERMLAPIEQLEIVRGAVRGHHEWWDGSGYPQGLAGDAIPLGARILALVDAWESMTAGRPHRAARTVAEACDEIRSLAGTQFDPAVIAAFERVLGRGHGSHGAQDGDKPSGAIARR